MKFRTELIAQKQTLSINHSCSMLTLGSCFADNIAEKMSYFKFDVLKNPFGISYNPVSISRLIARVTSLQFYNENDLFVENDVVSCFELHSKNNKITKSDYLENINTTLQKTHDFLKSTEFIFITLGTSWVYTYNGMVVNNCHKLPSKNFEKRMLSAPEINNSLNEIKENLQKLNSNLKIIYTLSPVRHTKDGIVENSLSKATLLAAIHLQVDSNTTYFPAYEIMMDDLRDYRFYKEDLIHPNGMAIEYIWEYFKSAYFEKRTLDILGSLEQVAKGIAHVPFNTESDSFQVHLQKMKKNIIELKSIEPRLNFDSELHQIENQLR